jgi:hypothetical protein
MKTLTILGHEIEVIVTDDKNILDGDNLGYFNTIEQRIAINDQASSSRRDEILFHELFEYLCVYFSVVLNHSAFKKFSSVLWAVLKENHMVTNGWLDDEK